MLPIALFFLTILRFCVSQTEDDCFDAFCNSTNLTQHCLSCLDFFDCKTNDQDQIIFLEATFVNSTAPTQIGCLANLKRVHLTAENGTIPTSLLTRMAKMNLTELVLEGFHFHWSAPNSYFPKAFKRLQNLTLTGSVFLNGSLSDDPYWPAHIFPNVDRARIDNCGLTNLWIFPNASFMNCSSNALTQFPFNLSAVLGLRLKELLLENNAIRVTDILGIYSLAGFPHLQKLSIKGTWAGNFPTSLTQNLTELEWFDVSDCPLEGPIPDTSFQYNPALTHIYADNCNSKFPRSFFGLTGTIPESWGSLPLQVIQMGCHSIDPTNVDHLLSRWVNLTVLNLYSKPIGESNRTEATGSLPNLEHLTRLETFVWAGIDGTIPTSIGYLTALKRLELGSLRSMGFCAINSQSLKITGAIPSQIGALSQLEILNISCQSLNHNLPTEFGKLTSLRLLDLSSNALTGNFHPGNFAELMLLDLSTNYFATISTTLGYLTSLHSLSLSRNTLTTLPSELGELAHLTNLDLSLNRIFTVPDQITHLSALQTLSVASNSLDAFPINTHWKSLTSLDFSNNRLSTLPDLSSLTGLQWLSLSLNNFPQLPHLPQNLESLNFQLIAITGSFPTSICQLTKLTSLALDSTKLYGTLPTCLRYLTKLQTISMRATGITHGCFPFDAPLQDCQLGHTSFACSCDSHPNQCSVLSCYNSTDPCNQSQCVYPATCISSSTSYSCSCDHVGTQLIDEYNCQLPASIPAFYSTQAKVLFSLGMTALVVILAIAGVYFWRRSRRLDLSSLPIGVRYTYEHYQNHPQDWKTVRIGTLSYSSLQILPGTNEWSHLVGITDKLGGPIVVEEAYAIFNESLISSFIDFRNTLKMRFEQSASFFLGADWKRDPSTSFARNQVATHYQNLVDSFKWNKGATVPIIPAAHGTEFNYGRSIAATGFAASISISRDTGFFGTGIYFTSNMNYAIPYFSSVSNPAILIAFIIPGNIFPVVEHHSSPQSLKGQPITPGHNSHYVVVQKNGCVAELPLDANKRVFDEIVIPQEPQIAPAYLLKLPVGSTRKLAKKWKQEQ